MIWRCLIETLIFFLSEFTSCYTRHVKGFEYICYNKTWMFMIEYRYFPEIYSINGMDVVRNKVPIGTLAGSKDIKYIFF